MENNKNPNIRFKGFTDPWEQRKLGDIITEYKETVDSDCTLPILTSSKTEGVILQEEHFGRKQQHDITGYNILPRNYCTYRNRSDGVDFTFNINKCCDKGIISKFYPVFSGKNSDVFFLSLVLNNSEEVVREIAYTCTGTGQKVLSFLDLQKMKVRVPNFDEQKEIAAYFDSFDHLITLHQRKYNKLLNVKKSMLEKMFPKNGSNIPEIRFKGFTDPWEQRKLGDCFTERVESMPDGELISVTINDGIKKFSELGRHNNSNDDKSKYKKVCIGDIAYNSMRMWQGASGYSPYEGIVSPAYTVLSPNSGINSKCLAYQFKLPEMIHTFQINSQGITSDNWNLKYPALSEIEIFVSKNEKEQAKIAEYFEGLDRLITLHQRELEKLQNIKKSMLEKMFV